MEFKEQTRDDNKRSWVDEQGRVYVYDPEVCSPEHFEAQCPGIKLGTVKLYAVEGLDPSCPGCREWDAMIDRNRVNKVTNKIEVVYTCRRCGYGIVNPAIVPLTGEQFMERGLEGYKQLQTSEDTPEAGHKRLMQRRREELAKILEDLDEYCYGQGPSRPASVYDCFGMTTRYEALKIAQGIRFALNAFKR